jgi:hypothetical protein
VLFQILQLLFSSILLFDIPKNLSDVFFEYIIISKYNLGCIPSYSSNLPLNILVVYEIVDISLDLIKSYTAEITNNIYYFSWLAIKQVLVKKDIDIYRYKEIVEFSSIFIEDIKYLDNSNIFLHRKRRDSQDISILILRRSSS